MVHWPEMGCTHSAHEFSVFIVSFTHANTWWFYWEYTNSKSTIKVTKKYYGCRLPIFLTDFVHLSTGVKIYAVSRHQKGKIFLDRRLGTTWKISTHRIHEYPLLTLKEIINNKHKSFKYPPLTFLKLIGNHKWYQQKHCVVGGWQNFLQILKFWFNFESISQKIFVMVLILVVCLQPPNPWLPLRKQFSIFRQTWNSLMKFQPCKENFNYLDH